MLTVTIRYRTTQLPDWQACDVDPDDYFWHDADRPARAWEVDDCPQHQEAIAYLSVPPRDVVATVVRVVDSVSGDFWEVASQILDGSTVVSITTAEIDGMPHKELVLSAGMPLKENGSQVVRVSLSEAVPRVSMNTIMWGEGGNEYSLDVLTSQQSASAS